MGLQRQLKDAEAALAHKADGSRLLKEEVTEDDIAEIISKWTGETCSSRMCSNRMTHIPKILANQVLSSAEPESAYSAQCFIKGFCWVTVW